MAAGDALTQTLLFVSSNCITAVDGYAAMNLLTVGDILIT